MPDINLFLSPSYFVSTNTLFYHIIRIFMKFTVLCQEVRIDLLWMSYATPNQNGAKKGSATRNTPPPPQFFADFDEIKAFVKVSNSITIL